MLASEAKLAVNNICALAAVLDALRLIRENGGYGGFEGKVKDGKVMYVKKIIEEHVD
jgi:hypothetical protein